MANIRSFNAQVRHYFAAAVTALAEEYPKPNRVKLTHFWLAEKLGISKPLAFALLARVAQTGKFYCLRLPNGPVYWKDDLISVGKVLDAFVSAQRQK